MENKNVKHSYNGMQQDTTQSQFPQNFYFEGRNIRINSTNLQSTNSVTNEKGNSLILKIPTPVINNANPNLKKIVYNNKELVYKNIEIDDLPVSGEQVIIGNSNSRDALILFTTDNSGFDCIWKMNYESYDLTLLYVRNMQFSKNNPIQTINNFENKNIDKVYWVDSNSQTRFININHSIENKDFEELIDIPVGVIDMVGKYDLSQPIITDITSGGNHTSGMIQYAYNLYRLNSFQTKISPLSKLVPLAKGSSGGGALNESVGSLPIVKINNIDPKYTNIKVYAIKYTSYNEIPSIGLIEDKIIPDNKNIEIFDDGSVISTVSLEEFLFLGSDVVIPRHIESKDNRLFLANYKEINFNINLDTRAYSFPLFSNSTLIYKGLFLDDNSPSGTPFTVVGDYNVEETHDSVNLNYNMNRYQYNSSVIGGEGKYLKYTLLQNNVYNPNNKYFKDDEIYRLGVVFYNKYGQKSLPKWISDFKSNAGNLKNNYNTLKVEFKPEFLVWLNTSSNFETEYDIPVGYKIVIAERTIRDKTIVANGFITPMMVNYKTTNQNANSVFAADKTIADTLPKLPNILARNCTTTTNLYGNTKPLKRCKHLETIQGNPRNPDSEIQSAFTLDKDTSGKFFQYNSMMQMYSPEVLFGESVSLTEGLIFKVKGAITNTDNNAWRKVLDPDDLGIFNEGKAKGGLSSYYSTFKESIVNDVNQGFDHGLFAHPSGGDVNKTMHTVFYRVYSNTPNNFSNNSLIFKTPVNSTIDYELYGKPEFTEKGQSFTTYNNDPKYRYTNSLESFYSDGDSGFNEDGLYGRRIVSVNNYGNRCLTFVLGKNPQIAHFNRVKLENLLTNSSITGDNYGIIGEFIKTNAEIYLGNIYGGNTFEDKKRTNYIEIGDYITFNTNSLISDLSLTIDSPGDTFVNNFKFLRITNTDIEGIKQGVIKYQEIVEVLCETTVDLKNRNDISPNNWDSRFLYQDTDYHKYNRVYSQNSNLVRVRDINYNVKKLNFFDTNIISSKLKLPGELIDSWTDILQNEVLTLDGKYGSINNLVNFNDQIYGIQDRAFTFISINPRIQIQGDDGISVELGTGSVLQEYKYINTKSGSVNKWGTVSTSNGIYYYDLLNKSLMVFNGQINNLSNSKGLHSYFTNNSVLQDLKIDNPLIKKGVSCGYDQINNDVFMTFHQNAKNFTISYNQDRNQFISFYDYLPSMYINNGQYFITTNPDITSVYRQYDGDYNKFYGQNYPSLITLNVNPEANLDTVFDNIMYKSEIYLNDIDQSDKTLTKVRLYNEYQDSGIIPLVVGRNSNLRRKFRDWNAILPRNQGSRERIRNPWVKLVLQFDNTSNYKLILHDVYVNYSV
jgi:hypothetical protein